MRFQTKGQAVFRVIVKRPYPESRLERAQLGLLRFRPLQLSDADADESNPMIAFGKLIGELHADLREDLLIEHVGPQGPLSQVGLESLETYLDPDRAEGRVLGPTPLIFVTGSGSRKAVTSSGRTTFSPSGFAMSEAIFAIDLFGPTPIVQARPSFSRTAALTFAAYAATSSNPWTFDVMSRNASSMLTCSRTSAKDRRTSMTLSEAAM